MENNIHNKAKYFAQHWGQRVIYNNKWDENQDIEIISQFTIGHYSDSIALVLKPLSSITDEDAIEVAEIVNISNYDFLEAFDNPQEKCKTVITSKKDGDAYGGLVHIYPDGSIYWDYHNKDKWGNSEIRFLTAYQLLQSKGYALPFMGLSIEQLIEYGWLKLKSN